MGYGTDILGGSRGGYGTLIEPLGSWRVHNAQQVHSAENLVLSTPPELVVANTSHGHLLQHLTLSYRYRLEGLDSWHRHRANQHYFRLDLELQERTVRYVNNEYLFELADSYRGFSLAGFQQTTAGTTEITNDAIGLHPSGIDSLRSDRHFTGHVRPYHYMSLSRFSTAVMPIEFDLQDEPENLLFIHANQIFSTATHASLTARTPLTVQDSGHTSTSTDAGVTNRAVPNMQEPVHLLDSTQVVIRHNITLQNAHDAIHSHSGEQTIVIHRPPARASNTTHAATSDEPSLRHTSPLTAHTALKDVTDDLGAIRHRSLVTGHGGAHNYSSDQLAITHKSLLVISEANHYHRAQALSFLPEDWVFRAIAQIEISDRVASVPISDRSATVEIQHRSAQVQEINRVVTVPVELREQRVPLDDRTATVIARGEVQQIGG